MELCSGYKDPFQNRTGCIQTGRCDVGSQINGTVYDQINKDEGVIVGMNGKEIADGILKILKDPHQYSEYLSQHEYGNEKEIEGYYQLFNLQ